MIFQMYSLWISSIPWLYLNSIYFYIESTNNLLKLIDKNGFQIDKIKNKVNSLKATDVKFVVVTTVVFISFSLSLFYKSR